MDLDDPPPLSDSGVQGQGRHYTQGGDINSHQSTNSDAGVGVRAGLMVRAAVGVRQVGGKSYLANLLDLKNWPVHGPR